MTLNLRYLGLFLLIVLPKAALAQGVGGMDEALSFARKLGYQGTLKAQIPDPDGKTLLFEGKDVSIGVDARTLDTVLWIDSSPEAVKRPPFAGRPVLSGEDDAWNAVTNWAKKAELPLGAKDVVKPQYEEGAIREYVLRYVDKPYGYRAKVGNRITISINALTGRIGSMTRTAGFTYDPPNIRISPEAAEAAVQSRVQQVDGIVPTGLKVEGLSYTTGGNQDEYADPAMPNLWERRKARLAYDISGDLPAPERTAKFHAVVDAETGMVLGGGTSKEGKRPSQVRANKAVQASGAPGPLARSQVQRVSGSDYVLPLAILILALAGGTAAFLRRKRPKATA